MLFLALKEFDNSNWQQNYSIMLFFFFNSNSQWITGFSIVKYEVLSVSVFKDVFSALTRSICKFSDMLCFVHKF